MIKKYITNNFNIENNNSHFKGVIRLSDFNTNHASSRNMANRIVQDWGFDQFCRRNSEIKKQKKL